VIAGAATNCRAFDRPTTARWPRRVPEISPADHIPDRSLAVTSSSRWSNADVSPKTARVFFGLMMVDFETGFTTAYPRSISVSSSAI